MMHRRGPNETATVSEQAVSFHDKIVNENRQLATENSLENEYVILNIFECVRESREAQKAGEREKQINKRTLSNHSGRTLINGSK